MGVNGVFTAVRADIRVLYGGYDMFISIFLCSRLSASACPMKNNRHGNFPHFITIKILYHQFVHL